jgi:multicomponent Na+:H+ antiporter subunit G
MLQFIGWVLIIAGFFAILSAVLGLFRFPDFHTKIHAASLIDSFGLPVSFIGLACLQNNGILALKLVFVALIVLILSPVSSHALIRASIISNYRSKDLEEEHEDAV